jgi:hypothetical protein
MGLADDEPLPALHGGDPVTHRAAVGLPIARPKRVVKVPCAFCGRLVARRSAVIVRQEPYCGSHFTLNDQRIYRERNR